MDKDKAESLLKDLHEFSRGFIKMDFIYLSALGAVLAYFKIDGHDVYKNYFQIQSAVIIIAIMLALDCAFVLSSLRDRFDVLNADFDTLARMRIARIKHSIQCIIHLFMAAMVVGFVIGYFNGGKSVNDSLEEAAKIQDKIELYIQETGASPVSLRVINDNDFQSLIKKNDTNVDYKKTGKDDYEIAFKLKDGISINVAHYFILSDYLKKIYEKRE